MESLASKPSATEQASPVPAEGHSCVGEAPAPTLTAALELNLPAEAPLSMESSGVSVTVRNEDDAEVPVEISAIVDFGGMESRIVPLGSQVLDPGATAKAVFDFGAHAEDVAKMRFSGMLRFVARRLDTGEWVGVEPVFFHPAAPGNELLIYREDVLMRDFRGGDFRVELAAALLDEPSVVTTRVLDASAAPVHDGDGLEPDLAPEVTP